MSLRGRERGGDGGSENVRRRAASPLKSSLITVEGEAVITQAGRGAEDAAAVDGEPGFMGQELR